MTQTSKLDDRTGRSRSAALIVGILVVAFIGVALLKPWGSSGGPTASAVAVATHRASVAPSATVSPSEGPTPSALPISVPPTPLGSFVTTFTTPLPLAQTTAWTGIQWHILATDDPLQLVRFVLHWRRGFIALGRDGTLASGSTPVWTSPDGANWTPVTPAGSSPFWPGMIVVALAEVPTGLVALTELLADSCDLPTCEEYTPPVVSWASPDGLTWTPTGTVDLPLPNPNEGAPLLAAGPAGLVAVSTTGGNSVATSTDGLTWRSSTIDMPSFGFGGLVGTASAYTAVGTLLVGSDRSQAVTIQSIDGINWTGQFPLPAADAGTTLAASSVLSSSASDLVAARNGMIAVGAIAASPGATLWWQSSNGRTWQPMATYGPLGPTTCQGEGCGGQPNGLLVGDGTRLIALRGAQTVWSSPDGDSWQRLPATGDGPPSDASQAVLMPGGVLVSSPTASWYGQAMP